MGRVVGERAAGGATGGLGAQASEAGGRTGERGRELGAGRRREEKGRWRVV